MKSIGWGLAIGALLVLGALGIWRLTGGGSPDSGAGGAAPGSWPEYGRYWPVAEPEPDPDRAESLERLQSVGYLTGSTPASGPTGVTIYDSTRAEAGFNLFNSGHAPEALLMSMDGTVLHRWSLPFRTAFPDYPVPAKSTGPDYWRRVHLYPNGDLLAIHEGLGLVKLDRNSTLIWAYPGGAHHDLQVTPDGRIHVLTREARLIPRIDPREPVLEDFLTTLAPDGTVLESRSLLELFEDSRYDWVLERTPGTGDLFHTNTIEVLDGSQAGVSSVYAAGNILISLLVPDVLAVVDPVADRVVWAATGPWKAQHDPSVLPGGAILLLDNQGEEGRSRVIEYDPFAERILWTYAGTPEHPFFTFDCGAVSRLPGGNTLITETNTGRAFEVTPDGRLVWEYRSPHRTGERNEYVASVFAMDRLPPSFPLDWLQDEKVR